jgi:phosphatidylserine decarboxylase
MEHQYVERQTGRARTEKLIADRLLNQIYSTNREKPGRLFDILTSPRISKLLGFVSFDLTLRAGWRHDPDLQRNLGIDWSEALDPPEDMRTLRDVFERRIRYWECRPMESDPRAVVSPADARALLGSFRDTSCLVLKEKFFHFTELLGLDKTRWLDAFARGDYAVFRLTPDKYHYNHAPVTGRVVDIYEIPGAYHSCNPGAVVAAVTPYSKNKRVVTILDTDVDGGTRAGLVAMIEIVALMIGDIVQCYSDEGYDDPRSVRKGMLLKRGRPKSLYRPGSSTDVLLFQPHRVRFSMDLLENMRRPGASSRFSEGFGRPLVETDLRVRSTIGMALDRGAELRAASRDPMGPS